MNHTPNTKEMTTEIVSQKKNRNNTQLCEINLEDRKRGEMRGKEEGRKRWSCSKSSLDWITIILFSLFKK